MIVSMPSRREILLATTAVVAATMAGGRVSADQTIRRAEPIPARYVALKPSPFADAMSVNRRYLLSLDAERLLHNFYWSAGLEAKKPRYGGWESASIAGHTLGHWLSACALLVANSNDPEVSAALDHALAEMARIQSAEGDGYLGGMTVDRGGQEVPGKVIFEEVRRGQINVTWTLNGGWVPIYSLHKVLAGLIDAHVLAENPRALPIALGLAGYLAGVLDGLSEAQVQTVLSVEHGGVLESYAELYALTRDGRWLDVAERLRHQAVVDPLIAQQDRLAGLHANTQIPKIVGLARLYEVTGKPDYAKGAGFFYRTVVDHHSYVIGGNSEREHFGPVDQLAGRLTTATCEACNSYNMLKLTRHLYAWSPQASWFDDYERAQLNHILAHQRPDTGQFVYFMPLEAGAKRDYSTPQDSFWCCVGTGMESHAKHADSIYWRDADTIYVNLFTPSTLDIPGDVKLELETRYPQDGAIALSVVRAPGAGAQLAIRSPAWASDARIARNGRPLGAAGQDGYWRIPQVRAGDRISLTLPMTLRSDVLKGTSDTYAFLSGPLVLAADLGPAGAGFDGPAPALLAKSHPQDVLRRSASEHRYEVIDLFGQKRSLSPFYAMYDRRAAVYWRTFTPDSWAVQKDAYMTAEAERADLVRRTVDVFYIGEMQPERDHGLVATGGGPDVFYGRHNRSIPQGQEVRFILARRPGAAILQITYWGNDIDREMSITIDGQWVAVEKRQGPGRNDWVVIDYPAPETLKPSSEIRLVGQRNTSMIYGVRLIAPPRPRSVGDA